MAFTYHLMFLNVLSGAAVAYRQILLEKDLEINFYITKIVC